MFKEIAACVQRGSAESQRFPRETKNPRKSKKIRVIRVLFFLPQMQHCCKRLKNKHLNPQPSKPNSTSAHHHISTFFLPFFAP